MAKFKLTSWLRPSNDSTASAEKEHKKANRRSFSAFASVPAFKRKEESTYTPNSLNGDAKSATVPEEPTSTLTASTRMTELANKIATETAKIEKYMTEQGLAMPGSVTQDAADFPKLPADVQRSRFAVVHATAELERLMKGPKETVRWMAWGFLDVMALQILSSFGIPQLIPSEGTISLAELQTKTTLDPINLARLLRYSMTTGVFCEPTPGQIGHTAASMALAKDKALVDWVGFNTEDIFPASANVLKALKQYPEATSLTRTGFNFAFDTVDKEPMFATFGKDPARARRMGGAMASLTGGEGYEVFHLVDGGYDFSEIDKRGGTLVDIGGSHGFVCVDLGKKYRNMKFVVQDLPKTIDSTPKPICEDKQVADRITLQAHDFFTEQKVKDADVYFFRWILHNYSTPYAIKLLKNLVPALKPGARILINDHCLREPGSETPWDERVMRGMDLVMLTLLNAQERDEREFRQLFAAADEGYSFVGVTRKKGCRMSVVEAVWKPGEVVKEGEAKEEAEEETKPGDDGNVRETTENEGVDVKLTEEPKGEEGAKKEEEKPAEAKSE